MNMCRLVNELIQKKLSKTRPSLFSMSFSKNNGGLALKSPVMVVTAGFSLLLIMFQRIYIFLVLPI